MATKIEKLQATQMNLKLALSKIETLRQRDAELELKVGRLTEERHALRRKAQNLQLQVEKLQASLQRQQASS